MFSGFATMVECPARFMMRMCLVQTKQRPRLRRAVVQVGTIRVPNHVAVAKRVLEKSGPAGAAPAPPQLHPLGRIGVNRGAVHGSTRLVRFRTVGLRHELARVQIVVRARGARTGVNLVQIHVVVVADEPHGRIHIQPALVFFHHLLQAHTARALMAANVVPSRVRRLQVADARVERDVEPDEAAVLGALDVHIFESQLQPHDFIRARVAKEPRIRVVA